MIMPRPVVRLALALPLLIGCSTGALKEGSPITRESVSFEERLLATIPEEWEDVRGLYAMGIWFSPNGRSAAYLVWLTGELDEKPRCFIVINGKKEPEVGRVGESRGMCSFSDGHPRFSPDGSRFGYAFRLGNQEAGREGVMVDGVMGPLFDQVSDPVFSQDGLQFAYEAVEGDKQLAVINHKVVSRQFDKAELPVFSSDGRRTAYRASMLGKAEVDGWREVTSAFVVVDGVKGPECNWVGSPVFAQSGDLAYIAQTDGAYNIRGHSTSDSGWSSNSIFRRPKGPLLHGG